MATLPSNILVQVQTYQKAGMAYLDNMYCWISNSNKKFNNFQDLKGNLGNTVTFDLPPRYVTNNNLVVTFGTSAQRLQTLTVDQQFSIAYAFSAQQFIFNVEHYMKEFGRSAIEELGAKIETNVALNAISAVPVLDTAGNPTGALHTESGPYRFFGDGLIPINSFGQLATMLAFFRNYGAAPHETKGFLSDIAVPAIVNTGLGQFAIDRNNEDAMSWMVGKFSNCDWFQSNLLPIQNAGTVGNSAQVLTVVSTNDPTGAAITSITFSGATNSDANAIKSGDLLYFIDSVAGQPNLRYLTFIGHSVSSNPVQIRATANVAATGGGQVTIPIVPTLCSQVGNQNQNLAYNIVAGMQAKALPSHKAGMLYSGNSLFLAMPQLPDQDPFKTAYEPDPETGISLRYYYGAQFGQNQQGFVHDAIIGSTVIPEYSMRIIFPLTQ